MTSGGYAIPTKPHKKEAVLASLGRNGLETNSSCMRRRRRLRGRRFQESVPLFPGHLFVRLKDPFTGFERRVTAHLSGGERTRILLELFRRDAALDCDPDSLQPVAAVAGVA